MQHAINPGKIRYAVISCLLLLLAYSCKKEYTDYPYNDLEKFMITDNNGAELKAAIQDNKIIIYYPPLQTLPDSIQPIITVSDRATVSPASGAKIAFKEGVTYTVTAQDGSTKTYTLQSALNQPPLVINVVAQTTNLGNTFGISGEYIIADTAQTKVSLIGTDDKEHKIPGSFLTLTASAITVNLSPKVKLDTGAYKVKVVSGKRTAAQIPISVGEAFAKLSYPNITTIRRGEEYTVTDTSGFAVMIKRHGQNINRGVNMYVNNAQFVPVQVISLTPTACTIKIPADCPLGFFQLIYGKTAAGTNTSLFTLAAAKRVTILP